jgi:Ca-activated chloride channel family protein
MTGSVSRYALISIALLCGLWCVVGAQEPLHVASAPSLRILSPDPDAFISGRVELRAQVNPLDAATTVLFYVDGRQVCSVVQPPYECSWEAGPTINEHQVRVVANLAGGGRLVETVRTKSLGYADRADVNVVQVTVTVTKDGQFVPNIPQSAFHVKEDGRAQTITYFSSEDVPLELVAAVDVSGSMTTAMPKLKAAVRDFLLAVPSQAQVTLLGFNDTIFTPTRRATRPEDRVRAVDRLAAWGATALYDVILRGIEMLGRETGRKALVVFTDGEDQGSHATIEDVERRLQASDVTLYMIGQGRGVTLDRLKAVMTRLSLPTGGRALFTDNIDELNARFADLIEELSNQYLLGYPPTNAVRDNTWRRIEVQVDGYGDVRARQGYRAEPLQESR